MELFQQYEDQNKGLRTDFRLSESGGFLLSGGKDKVDNNVTMLLSFIGWFRLYTQEYVINVYQFHQNTTSYLYQFKNIIRLSILDIGKKYLPFANLTSVDIPINYSNRKETDVVIQFKYKLRNIEEYQTIKKIIL